MIPSNGITHHSSTLIFCTPDGAVAQYYQGIEYEPKELTRRIDDARQGIQVASGVEENYLNCKIIDDSKPYAPCPCRWWNWSLPIMAVGLVLTLIILWMIPNRRPIVLPPLQGETHIWTGHYSPLISKTKRTGFPAQLSKEAAETMCISICSTGWMFSFSSESWTGSLLLREVSPQDTWFRNHCLLHRTICSGTGMVHYSLVDLHWIVLTLDSWSTRIWCNHLVKHLKSMLLVENGTGSSLIPNGLLGTSDGPEALPELHVPANIPIELVMTSERCHPLPVYSCTAYQEGCLSRALFQTLV